MLYKKSKILYFNDISDIYSYFFSSYKKEDIIFITFQKLLKKYSAYNILNHHEKLIILNFDGEKCKSINIVKNIISNLIKYKANKKSKIIGIGGGTITDVVSFCASVFMRGINLTLVPTTLLSMIDAAIGGKTGINFLNIKNCVGTFYFPNEIIICPEFLKTLPIFEIENGLFEALKYGILFSEKLFLNIFNNYDILKKYTNDNKKLFLGIIKSCINFKNKIVKIDPFDNDKRHVLNFGHTLGHVIESISNYKIPHGLAVGIGMYLELELIQKFFGFDNKLTLKYNGLIKVLNTSLLYKKYSKLINTIDFTKQFKQFIIYDKKLKEKSNIIIPDLTSKSYDFYKISILDVINYLKTKKYLVDI